MVFILHVTFKALTALTNDRCQTVNVLGFSYFAIAIPCIAVYVYGTDYSIGSIFGVYCTYVCLLCTKYLCIL